MGEGVERWGRGWKDGGGRMGVVDEWFEWKWMGTGGWDGWVEMGGKGGWNEWVVFRKHQYVFLTEGWVSYSLYELKKSIKIFIKHQAIN